MKISCVINLDSRNQKDTADSLFNGTVNWDYWVDGLLNKIKFLEGFDKEIILYGDVHNEIPIEVLSKLQEMCDTVCLRKHTNEPSFNDWNYYRALSLATGNILLHFDQDSVAFSESKNSVADFIGLLDMYDFVSYQSHWSPYPVHDDSFDHVWCSTRFFMCKRESLDLQEISKCLKDYDYWCNTYPVARKCHWLEHLIGSVAKYRNQKVYYPPIGTNGIIIFSWGKYKSGVLKNLNNMDYFSVIEWLNGHPIHYPNDVYC